MREIKFRFFRESPSKKMIYDNPDIYVGFEGSVYGILRYSEKDIKFYQLNLIPLRFTGLKDKNGKEIYEGDIIRVWQYYDEDETELNTDYSNYEVKYCIENDYPAFDLWPHLDAESNGLSLLICGSWDGPEHFEVIGNIYENPDLI